MKTLFFILTLIILIACGQAESTQFDTILELEKNGLLEKAIMKLDSIQKEEPQNGHAIFLSGRINRKMGKYSQALDILTHLQNQLVLTGIGQGLDNPNYKSAYPQYMDELSFELGLVYFNLNIYDGAIYEFTNCTDNGYFARGQSHYYKGLSLLKINKGLEGCKELKKALEQNYMGAQKYIEDNCGSK